jgi:hypothetical protein
MSQTPRIRVVGLVVGLAVFALAAGFFLLSRGQASSSAATPHVIVPLSKRANGTVKKHAVKPAVRKPAVRKPAVRKPAVHKPVQKPVQKQPAETANGIPSALAAALTRNKVVVVSLYAPRVELDDMATREARAGAAAAGVGFVAIDVLKESQSRSLTKLLGVLEDPAVLVFRRPGDLVIRFSGFADKQTVLQAARNAGL